MTKFAQSAGTTSAASLRQDDGRRDPFNQVVHGIGSASRVKQSELRIGASGCSSPRRAEPSLFSSVKENNKREAYRSYNEEGSAKGWRDEAVKQPLLSKYGRELSEKMETDRLREDSANKIPQSAREGHRNSNHSLRDFSRSPANREHKRGSESHRVHSPTFFSG